MNLVLLGRGKTGSLVAEVARERGHEARVLGSADNAHGSALTREALAGVGAVIDFTTPQAVLENIAACARAGTNLVVGTTGWHAELLRVRQMVESSGIGFVYAANFSIGVNVFFDVARAAGKALGHGYAGRIVERHHAQKKDSPSGTAVVLQKLMAEGGGSAPEITSIREGDTVGTHIILLDSGADIMMLVHDAKSRRGFAEGAVRSAEWLQGKKGFFEFGDVLKE